MSQVSRYQIVHDKVILSDLRFDVDNEEIHKLFDKLNIINGIYTKNIEDFSNGKLEEIERIRENLERKREDLKHKIMAIKYSLSLIKEQYKYVSTKEFIENNRAVTKLGRKTEFINEVLIYETESFLFQVKSSLDIFVQFLKFIPRFNYLQKCKEDRESFVLKSYGKNKSTADKIIENGDVEFGNLVNCNVDNWIFDLNKRRNDITHRSKLKSFTNFVYEVKNDKIIDPKMNNSGENVLSYCKKNYSNLFSFYEIVIDKFILPELEKMTYENRN